MLCGELLAVVKKPAQTPLSVREPSDVSVTNYGFVIGILDKSFKVLYVIM